MVKTKKSQPLRLGFCKKDNTCRWDTGNYGVFGKNDDLLGSFDAEQFGNYLNNPEAFAAKFYEFSDFDENNGNGGGGGDPKKKKASKKTSKKTSTIGGAGLVLTAEIVEAAGVLGSLSWVSVFGTALLLNGDSSPDRFAEFAQYGGVAGSWPWQHAASRDIV